MGDFTQGVIHDHIMNFKLDFDVDGTENSFVIQRLKSRAERPDWIDDDEEDTVSSYLEQEWLYNEDDGRLNWPSNSDATYLIGMFEFSWRIFGFFELGLLLDSQQCL